MAQFVIIDTVRCIAQDDLTGSDTIYALNGGQRYPIGTFSDGESNSNLTLEIAVIDGSPISIYEHDDIGADDHIGDLDISQFGPQINTIGNGSAEYTFEYRVS